MKILFFINSIGYGGAERVITNLANQFSAKGHEILFVTSIKKENEYPLSNNIKRIVLIKKSGRLLKNLSFVKQLRRILKEESPQCAVSFMAESNFRLLVAARGLKIRTIISVRNDPNREYPSLMTKLLAKNLYKKASGIVFQTTQARNWFPKKVIDKSTIILNQVDETFFSIEEEVTNRKDIVAVGRLTEQKNFQSLIMAFSKIVNEVDDNLYIYGEGKLRDNLLNLIQKLSLQNRVFLMGLSNNIKHEMFNKKLFVLSSLFEGLPNCLMEAMALGLPCIATDCPCGGPYDLLSSITPSVLCKDTSEIADKMLMFLSDDKILHLLSKQIKHKAEEFRPAKIFNQWSNFIINGSN